MMLWTRQERIFALSIVGFGLALGIYCIACGLVLPGSTTILYYLWAVTTSAERFASAHRNVSERHFHVRRILGMVLSVPVGLGIVGCVYFIEQHRIGVSLLVLTAGIVGNIAIHLIWNIFAIASGKSHGA